MRRPSEIPGGVPGLARWAVGGVFRVARRLMQSIRRRVAAITSAPRERILALVEGRRWQRSVRRSVAGRFDVEVLLGTVSNEDLIVITCLWNRPSRIDAILAELDAQSTDVGLRLMLWNNQPADDAHYRDRITAFAPRGALRSVEYVSSAENLGGLARFFLARRALSSGTKRREFITLDDDQDVADTFVDDLLAAGGPRRVAGVWAWRYLGRSHWDRTPANPGDDADYVGTGGCICDIALVSDVAFFAELPPRYRFLEDQWMCAYARARGWTLTKVDTPVEFVLHETNQFPALATLKDEFRDYLAGPDARQQTAR